jgi:hypothetical protein
MLLSQEKLPLREIFQRDSPPACIGKQTLQSSLPWLKKIPGVERAAAHALYPDENALADYRDTGEVGRKVSEQRPDLVSKLLSTLLQGAAYPAPVPGAQLKLPAR